MEKFVIIPDPKKDEAIDCAKQVLTWFLKRNISAALFAGDDVDFSGKSACAILLGGDGFIMRKSLELAKSDIPFLAINFGRKGFLAGAEQNNWQEVLEKVLNGKYKIQRRLTLAVRLVSKKGAEDFKAAGDVYIRHRTSMTILTVIVDGELTYEDLLADGVVVATPTGSTGYNRSMGGPVIETGMVVTPMAPYAENVTFRHLEGWEKIKIIYSGSTAHEEDEGCLLYIDGKKYPIEPGDEVLIQRSEKEALFIIPEGFSFWRAAQEKMGMSK